MGEHESRYTDGEGSFDELAKGLSSGALSRRGALRMLGAAMLGGALASIPGVAWTKGTRCPRGTHRCPDGSCVPKGQACGSKGCPTGETKCNGTCRNLQTDTLNCGTCGNACPAGHSCVNGGCSPGCPPNTELHQPSGRCVSTVCSAEGIQTCGSNPTDDPDPIFGTYTLCCPTYDESGQPTGFSCCPSTYTCSVCTAP